MLQLWKCYLHSVVFQSDLTWPLWVWYYIVAVSTGALKGNHLFSQFTDLNRYKQLTYFCWAIKNNSEMKHRQKLGEQEMLPTTRVLIKGVCVSTLFWSESIQSLVGMKLGFKRHSFQCILFFHSIHRQVVIYSFSFNQCQQFVNFQFE